MPPRPTLRRLTDVAGQISDADLLLFRRPRGALSWFSRGITVAGRSIHSHAAMAVRFRCADCGDKAHDILLCVEMREWVGGRAVTLESQVAKYPGRIDVYRSNPPAIGNLQGPPRWAFDRPGAAALMLQKAGQPYGWGAILTSAILHLPLVAIALDREADNNDLDCNGRPEYCSAAVSDAIRRGGGVDPVPTLADACTEPGDLARSPFFAYQWTIA